MIFFEKWRNLTDTNKVAIILAFLALIYSVLSFGVLPRHVFFSPDEGDKIIAAISAARRGDVWRLAYEYPGYDVDPEGTFFFTEWVRLIDGKPVPFHLSVLIFVNAPLYRLLGWNAFYVLPLLSGLGIIWLSYQLARLIEAPHPWVVPLIAGLCTPVFFFSLTTWDHMPTVFCSTLIVYLLTRQTRRFQWWEVSLAGAVIGLGLWMRFEMYLFTIAVGLAYIYVFWRQRMIWPGLMALAAGSAVVFAAMMVQQWAVYGTAEILPLSVRASTIEIDRQGAASMSEALRNVILRQARVLLALTLDSPSVWLERVFLALAFVGVIVVNWFAKLQRHSWLVVGSVLLQVAGTILAVIHRYIPETIVGLIPTLPLASLGLVYASPTSHQDRPPQRMALDLIATVSVSFFLFGLVLLPSFGGPSWGPRYLAPLFPLLAVLAWATRGRASVLPNGWNKKAIYVAFGIVFVLSLAMQWVGVWFLYDYKQTMVDWYDELRVLDVYYVLSDSHWFLRQVSNLYFDRCFCFLSSQQNYQTLVERLARKGVDRFAWIAAADTQYSPEFETSAFAVRHAKGAIYTIVPIN